MYLNANRVLITGHHSHLCGTRTTVIHNTWHGACNSGRMAARREWRSPVWQYFEITEDLQKVQCKVCQSETLLPTLNGSIIRWHPLMIEWWMYLQHKLSGTCENLPQSDCISLSLQHTVQPFHISPSIVHLQIQASRDEYSFDSLLQTS